MRWGRGGVGDARQEGGGIWVVIGLGKVAKRRVRVRREFKIGHEAGHKGG